MYKIEKTILTIAGSALIALSTVQLAAASEHQGRTHHRSTASAQFRHSNAYAAPAYVAVQPEWPGYGYGGYYSGGYSAPARPRSRRQLLTRGPVTRDPPFSSEVAH